MLYTKPKNMKYTDMCIFFDENFYSENRDDEKCYKYMYLIYYMLACKKKFFQKYEEYDDYAQYAANTIYVRFLKKQSNGERIKSILNYAKASYVPLKVMYQNSEYREEISEEYDDKLDVEALKRDIKSTIQSQYSEGMEDAILDLFSTIPYIIREEVWKTPYKSSPLESKRIYMSCLITLLKSFTLSNYNMARREKRGISMSDEMVIKIYEIERTQSLTLWKLDSTMKDYIAVLVNKIRKRIANELLDIKNSYELSEDVLDTIMLTSWETSTHGDFEEEQLE